MRKSQLGKKFKIQEEQKHSPFGSIVQEQIQSSMKKNDSCANTKLNINLLGLDGANSKDHNVNTFEEVNLSSSPLIDFDHQDSLDFGDDQLNQNKIKFKSEVKMNKKQVPNTTTAGGKHIGLQLTNLCKSSPRKKALSTNYDVGSEQDEVSKCASKKSSTISAKQHVNLQQMTQNDAHKKIDNAKAQFDISRTRRAKKKNPKKKSSSKSMMSLSNAMQKLYRQEKMQSIQEESGLSQHKGSTYDINSSSRSLTKTLSKGILNMMIKAKNKSKNVVDQESDKRSSPNIKESKSSQVHHRHLVSQIQLDDLNYDDGNSLSGSSQSQLFEEIESINDAFQMNQFAAKNTKQQLQTSKIFLNMVIHDMRTPTTSVKSGLQQSIIKQREIIKIYNEQLEFQSKCKTLSDEMNKNHQKFKTLMHKSNCSQHESNDICECIKSLKQHVINMNSGDIQELLQNIEQQQLEIMKDMNLTNDADEPNLDDELVDYMEEEMDENYFNEPDQIVQQNFQFHENREQMVHNQKPAKESIVIQEKRTKLLSDIKDLLSQHKIDSNSDGLNQDFDHIVSEFVNKVTGQESPYDKFSSMVDQSAQTTQCGQDLKDKIVLKQEQKEKFHELSKNIVNLKDKIGSQSEKFEELTCELDFIQLTAEQIIKFEETNRSKAQAQAEYFSQKMESIYKESIDSQRILQNQIFSQQMMENLINDLLDLAKLENDQFTFSRDFFNLGDSILDAFHIIISSANENKISLCADIDSVQNLGLIQALYGDQRRYQQILLNFLSNALKFTDPKGKITVSVKILNDQLCIEKNPSKQASSNKQQDKFIEQLQQQQQNDCTDTDILNLIKNQYLEKSPQSAELNEKEKMTEGQTRYLNIELSIIDTGVGMSPEGVNKLFIDFNKLDENSQRNKGGTGLGLSICKKIIEQMGGSVDVKSQVGVGSQFIINLKTQCIVKNVKLDEDLLAKKVFEKPVDNAPFNFIKKDIDETEMISCIQDQISENLKNKFQGLENEISEFNQMTNMAKKSALKNNLDKQNQWHNHIDKMIENQRNTGFDQIRSTVNKIQQVQRSISLPQKGFKQKLDVKKSDKKMNEKKSKSSQKLLKKYEISVVEEVEEEGLISHLSKRKPSSHSESQILENSEIEQELEEEEPIKMKCLIANDDECTLYMMEIIMKLHNFEVTTATNGFVAYQYASQAMKFKQENINQIIEKYDDHEFRAGADMYDLIILDLNMPISDGYEACEKILKLYEDNSIFRVIKKEKNGTINQNKLNSEDIIIKNLKPLIIACTSDNINEDGFLQKLMDTGFDTGIMQPLTTSQVKNVINEMLYHRENTIQNQIRINNMLQESNEYNISNNRHSSIRRQENMNQAKMQRSHSVYGQISGAEQLLFKKLSKQKNNLIMSHNNVEISDERINENAFVQSPEDHQRHQAIFKINSISKSKKRDSQNRILASNEDYSVSNSEFQMEVNSNNMQWTYQSASNNESKSKSEVQINSDSHDKSGINLGQQNGADSNDAIRPVLKKISSQSSQSHKYVENNFSFVQREVKVTKNSTVKISQFKEESSQYSQQDIGETVNSNVSASDKYGDNDHEESPYDKQRKEEEYKMQQYELQSMASQSVQSETSYSAEQIKEKIDQDMRPETSEDSKEVSNEIKRKNERRKKLSNRQMTLKDIVPEEQKMEEVQLRRGSDQRIQEKCIQSYEEEISNKFLTTLKEESEEQKSMTFQGSCDNHIQSCLNVSDMQRQINCLSHQNSGGGSHKIAHQSAKIDKSEISDRLINSNFKIKERDQKQSNELQIHPSIKVKLQTNTEFYIEELSRSSISQNEEIKSPEFRQDSGGQISQQEEQKSVLRLNFMSQNMQDLPDAPLSLGQIAWQNDNLNQIQQHQRPSVPSQIERFTPEQEAEEQIDQISDQIFKDKDKFIKNRTPNQ